MTRMLLACALFALSLNATAAAENPWVGTWKFDPARSHIVGDTFIYSKAANGLIHFADGSTASYDFGVDGKEYKAWGNRTTTWTPAGSNAWNTVSKQEGVTVYEAHRELSADGKTLTITATGKRPDGSPANDVTVYSRVGSGSGLVGKWRSTRADVPAPAAMTFSAPSPGVLRIEVPTFKVTSEAKTDGTDSALTGPGIPPGYTMAVKAVSARVLSYAYKLNGKPDSYSTDTLSPDGKSFTSVSWTAGKPSEKSTQVYVRQ